MTKLLNLKRNIGHLFLIATVFSAGCASHVEEINIDQIQMFRPNCKIGHEQLMYLHSILPSRTEIKMPIMRSRFVDDSGYTVSSSIAAFHIDRKMGEIEDKCIR